MKPMRKFDAAQFYYWSMQFIEPANPDDDRYVILHGDEGEILGPMTMQLADQWLRRSPWPSAPLLNLFSSGSRT